MSLPYDVQNTEEAYALLDTSDLQGLVAPFDFAAKTSAGDLVVANATTKPLGIYVRGDEPGKGTAVAHRGSRVPVVAGGDVTPGDTLVCTTGGKVIATTDPAGKWTIGRALTAGGEDDLIVAEVAIAFEEA